MVITIEGQTFNTDSLKGMTESNFRSAFQGKVKCDLTAAWKMLRKHIESPPEIVSYKKKKKKASK